jgi:hypothetical protein
MFLERQSTRLWPAIVSTPLLLAACGGASSPFGGPAYGKLDQGQWQLTATLGTPSGNTGREPPLVVKQCVDKVQALKPVREAVLAMADRAKCGSDAATIANGVIGGKLRCKGMDDIPEHDEAISGSYSHDRFRIAIDIPVFGMTARQTIDAKRIGDC